MFEYLTFEERQALALAIIATAGYGPAQRIVIIGSLPLWLRGQLPGGAAGPLTDAMLDLGALSGIERLSDGQIPIKEFLKAALFLAGTNVAADPIRRKLAEIETQSTGAAPVPPGPPAEIQEKYVTRTAMVERKFIAGAFEAAKAVAKLSVARFEGGAMVTASGGAAVIYVGTCWIVAPGLMLTNHHVINARNGGEAPAEDGDFQAQLKSAVVRFDYDEESLAGVETAAGDLVAADRTLDYALFRIAVPERRPIRIVGKPILEVVPGAAMAVNIIQHPDGHAKKWAVRNNLVSSATAAELRYFTDTLNGSSGSPVMNDDWEAVALHRGSKFVTGVQFQGRDVAYLNVGTQMQAILDDLRAKHKEEIPELGI